MSDNNQNQSEIIQIESIEKSDYGVKINAQDKRVFNVSQKKQDGTISVAWQQMLDMGLKGSDPITNTAGSKVEIWYRETPNRHGGTSRYIASFKEAGNRPVGKLGNTQPQAQNSSPRASQSVTGQTSRDYQAEADSKQPINWERLGLIKAFHNLAAARLSAGVPLEVVKQEITSGEYKNICDLIENAL